MAPLLGFLLASEFISAGQSYRWKPEIVWLHVISDALIAIAYGSLSAAIIYLGARKRDFAYHGLFLMFGAFTLACGVTHLLQVWSVWNPAYRLEGAGKLITGLLSIATAVVFIHLLPKIRVLPSRAQLKATNQALEKEIAERNKVEEELRKQTKILSLVLENMAEGVVVADEKEKFIVFNRAAERIAGVGPTDVGSREWSQQYGIYCPDTKTPWPAAELPLVRAMRGDDVDEQELFIRNPNVPDGVWIWVTARALRDETGTIRGGFAVLRDSTERKHAEEQIRRVNQELEQRVREQTAELKRSNEELQQFAYVASHDLQEPLRMISTYTQLLAKRYKGRLDPEADEIIDLAAEGVRRMRDLIHGLLAYSRVVSAKMDTFQRTSCEAVFSWTASNLKVAIEESGAVVTHDPLPEVVADEVQLVQLFQNLIGNALKYRSQEPPRIHVSAERRGEEWVFSVRDNGIGIDPQYFDSIFVVFKRLHGKEYPGAGLGLAICAKVLERHGGRIWVKSEPGKGSVFYFTMPVA